MPTLVARARIERWFGRRKHVLPNPGALGVWVLSFQSKWQIDFAATAGEILAMYLFDVVEVRAERSTNSLRQKRNAFPHAFSVAHGNPVVAEIDIFDPQSQAFH